MVQQRAQRNKELVIRIAGIELYQCRYLVPEGPNYWPQTFWIWREFLE